LWLAFAACGGRTSSNLIEDRETSNSGGPAVMVGGGGEPGVGASAGGTGGEPDQVQCRTARDCFLDNACSQVSCRHFRCRLEPRGSGAPCTSGGVAGVCDGEGACLACRSSADCRGGACVEQQCWPATCFDGVLNGFEIDVDCGGECLPCD